MKRTIHTMLEKSIKKTILLMLFFAMGCVCVTKAQVTCDGTHYTTLNAAVAAASTPGAVIVPLGSSCPVTSNLTVPSNVTLITWAPSLIAISANVTLTINGPVQFPHGQVFSYASGSAVQFGSPAPVEPMWFPGTTADVQITNAYNSLPSGGGTLDLTGYGPSTQTISSTVTGGSASKPVKFIASPATTFQPGSAGTTMFQISDQNEFLDFHFNTNNFVAYTGAVFTNNPSQSIQFFKLEHIHFNMALNTSTGNAILFNSTSTSNGVEAGALNDITCYGNTNASCFLLENSSTGYVNQTQWGIVKCLSMKYCFDLEQGGSGAISGNVINNLFCEHGNLAGALACVNINATGSTNLAGFNQFIMNAWDITASNKAFIITSGSNGKACSNEFKGMLFGQWTNNDSSCTSGYTGTVIVDITAQSSPTSQYWIPSLYSRYFSVGNGNAITGSGAGGIALAMPGGSNSTGGAMVQTKRVSGCTTAASVGGTCSSAITITWGTAFPNASYTVSCTAEGTPTNVPSAPYAATVSASGITVNYLAITAAAASWPFVECIAIHD